MQFRNFSIKAKMSIVIGVFTVGFVAFIANVSLGLKPKLEDSAYKNVVVLKDVVADVLPPPKYIIESYLVLLQMSIETDPKATEGLEKRWGELRTEYNARQDYWTQELWDGHLKSTLLDASHESAMAFYAMADRDLIPAIKAGDRAKATQLLDGPLQDLYQAHRATIDEVVSTANRESEASIAAAADSITAEKRELILLGGVIAAIGCVIGLLIARDTSRRLGGAVDALSAVADGDFTKQVDVTASDEVGRMSEALNRAVGSIRTTLERVRGVAEALAHASAELSSTGTTISGGAQRHASQLEETAANLHELTTTVKQNADSAQQASHLAVGARDVADSGGKVVSDAVTAMAEINAASRKIADILSAIDEIAFQTNLLALNAAVEAARAGEQGRGFAVVASEVRNLAQRSAKAAKEIKTLIDDSVSKVSAGTKLVEQSGESLRNIVTSVKRVTDIVAEIAAATREQSSGIDQVNMAVNEMDSVTQANAAETGRLASTAEELARDARDLQTLVSRFHLESTPG